MQQKTASVSFLSPTKFFSTSFASTFFVCVCKIIKFLGIEPIWLIRMWKWKFFRIGNDIFMQYLNWLEISRLRNSRKIISWIILKIFQFLETKICNFFFNQRRQIWALNNSKSLCQKPTETKNERLRVKNS